MVNIEDVLKNIDVGLLGKLQNIKDRFGEQLAQIPVVGEAGGGLVSVHGTAEGKVLRVHIADGLLADDQARKVLSDLLVAAFNTMHKKVEAEVEQYNKKEAMNMLPDWIKQGD